MTRVIITTSIRESPPHLASGRLFVVDVDQRKIVQATSGVEPPHRENDVNPRGGMRGMRGLSIYNGRLALATYSCVLIFDRAWNFLQAITHPAVAGIHEVAYIKNELWVTSTANDMLARFNSDGILQESIFLVEQAGLMEQLKLKHKKSPAQTGITDQQLDFRKRSYFASDPFDRLHVNSICILPEGQLLISLGLIVESLFNFQMHIKTLMMKMNVWNAFLTINILVRRLLGVKKQMLSELVVRPARGRSAVVIRKSTDNWDIQMNIPVERNPSHSVRALADGSFVYLLTSFGEVAYFDPAGQLIYRTKVTDMFLRGLLILPDGNFLVGASNCLLFFDPSRQEVFAEIKLSDNPMETIFDIQILPGDFGLPPDSLEEITGRIKSYQGNEVIWGQTH